MLRHEFAALGFWSLLPTALGQACQSGTETTQRPEVHRPEAAGGRASTAPPEPIGFAGEAGDGGAAAFDPNLWDECRTICREEARHHCTFDTSDGGAAGASDPDVPVQEPDCVAGVCRSDEIYFGGTCPREWAAVIHCLATLPLGSVSCVPHGWSWVGCAAEFGAYDHCSQPFP
jgi:hypothetical protein